MFKLSDSFFAKYEGREPKWGYGALSSFTFKRTYSRLMENNKQETFVDCLKRVTEGCFRTQEEFCKRQGLEWNPYRAQKTAQEFFQRMFEFKFLPPGRGMWVFGCPIVNKIGSAALNNCGFTSTKNLANDLASSFIWAMDSLMLGVGVGFDCCGAGKVIIKQPSKNKMTYRIPDSREGWVESVKLLINSYQIGNYYVEFIYDDIRPAGALIKGFGGTSSGPQPLIDLHNSIRKLLDELVGQPITSVAIVDLFNFIGKCVVSGNVRRSAEIAIGNLDDEAYITMKDYDKHPEELLDRRWASNNSVFVTNDSDFSKVTGNIIKNGEPGLIFLENARHYGRMKDGWLSEDSERYDNVDGFNPCLTGDTRVATQFGLLTIKELAEMKKQLVVTTDNRVQEDYKVDASNLGVSTRVASPAFQTSELEEVYEITTADGHTIKATAYHKFPTPQGFVQVKDLTIKDSLLLQSKEGIWGNKYDGAKYDGVDGRCYGQQDLIFKPTKVWSGIWSGTRECVKEYFYSLFSDRLKCDENSISINLCNFTNSFLKEIQILLNNFGIVSKIHKEKLIISENNAILFEEKIGFSTMNDIENFNNWKQEFNLKFANESFTTKIVSITQVESAPVFCLTQPTHHTFIANGIPTGNCSEQPLEDKELCCLVETFPTNHESAEDYYQTLKHAYLYAKTVTLIPTHDEQTNAVIMRNRRIGCSMSGIQQAIQKFGHHKFISEFCDKGYEVIKKYDRVYSRWLGIPRSIRMSTVKPSGTVSILAGALPGVHYAHSEFYFRTVRCAASSPLLLPLIKANYRIEYSVTDKDRLNQALKEAGYDADSIKKNYEEVLLGKKWDQGVFEKFGALGGTMVVYFPIKEKNFHKSKFDTTIWEQLSIVREMQYSFSDNAVSCTITFSENEQKDLESAIKFFAPYVKTLSFLPLVNHKYAQAPYQECTEEEYNTYVKSLKEVKFKSSTEGNISGSKFCDGDSCEV